MTPVLCAQCLVVLLVTDLFIHPERAACSWPRRWSATTGRRKTEGQRELRKCLSGKKKKKRCFDLTKNLGNRTFCWIIFTIKLALNFDFKFLCCKITSNRRTMMDPNKQMGGIILFG